MTTYHVPIPYLRSFDREYHSDSYRRAFKIRRGGNHSLAYFNARGVVAIRKGGAFGSSRSNDWQAKAWNAALAGSWDSYVTDAEAEARRRRIESDQVRAAYRRERVPA